MRWATCHASLAVSAPESELPVSPHRLTRSEPSGRLRPGRLEGESGDLGGQRRSLVAINQIARLTDLLDRRAGLVVEAQDRVQVGKDEPFRDRRRSQPRLRLARALRVTLIADWVERAGSTASRGSLIGLWRRLGPWLVVCAAIDPMKRNSPIRRAVMVRTLSGRVGSWRACLRSRSVMVLRVWIRVKG